MTPTARGAMRTVVNPRSDNAPSACDLNDPDNDSPQLVYADWLEEHGDRERAVDRPTASAAASWRWSAGPGRFLADAAHLHQNRLALARGEELAALLGDEHVLLQPDEARRGHHAQLQGE